MGSELAMIDALSFAYIMHFVIALPIQIETTTVDY